MGRSDGEICGDGTHLEHHGERCAHCSRCCGVGGAPLVKESGRVITQLTGARLGRIIDRDGPEGSAMGVSSGGGGEGGVGRGRREEGSREEVEQEGGEGLEGAALEEEASSVEQFDVELRLVLEAKLGDDVWTFVSTTAEGRGMELWRHLCAEFNPSTAGTAEQVLAMRRV